MECDAAVALIIDNDNFLLIKRADLGDPWSGQMALPGGHREKSETCCDTAVRETYEEVGIKIRITKYLGNYFTLNKTLSVAAFLAECVTKNVKIDNEVSKFFWVGFRDLKEYDGTFRYGSYIIFGLTYRILKDFSNMH